MGCGIGPACSATSFCGVGRPQPSLRDSRPFGVQPRLRMCLPWRTSALANRCSRPVLRRSTAEGGGGCAPLTETGISLCGRVAKSRQGRPKIAHGFNRGSRVKKGWIPGGAKENVRHHNPVLSSLTGLIRFSHQDPPMNRWAIFLRPVGLANIPKLVPHTPSLRSTSH
jgi:hypothetical protein